MSGFPVRSIICLNFHIGDCAWIYAVDSHRDPVLVRARNVERDNATNLAKEMLCGVSVERVLSEELPGRFFKLKVRFRDDEVHVPPHDTNGAVAVPHHHTLWGFHFEAHAFAVTSPFM